MRVRAGMCRRHAEAGCPCRGQVQAERSRAGQSAGVKMRLNRVDSPARLTKEGSLAYRGARGRLGGGAPS